MKRPTLTVCILAKNEETNIPRALASARPVADEIILVDTGSTDRTVAIALEYGARVVSFPWNGSFSDARNAGLENATCDWVLMLDADEVISQAMADEAITFLKRSRVEGFIQPMVNYRDGKAHSSTPVLRLFRNRPAYRFVGRIHEQVDRQIVNAGGTLEVLQLPIEHYGYTPAEDQRKNRRERNTRLLKETLADDPSNYSAWYFFGLEHSLRNELGQAAECFSKAISLGGNESMHATLAAHRLSEIALKRQRTIRVWELAQYGASYQMTSWDSALLTAQVALFEGDYDLAHAKIAYVNGAPAGDFGILTRHPSMLLNLEASALWLQGEQEKALALWEQVVLNEPDDFELASQYVKHKVLAEGLGPGLRSALQVSRTSQVASACVGALLRAGQLHEAGELARTSLEKGLTTTTVLYGVALIGRWEMVETMTADAGLEGAFHLATAAAWFDQPDLLSRALEQLTGSWRTAFATILSGQRVSEDLLWAADILMARWADVGCLPLLQATAQCLPGGPAVGLSRAAWLAYKAGMTTQALQMALQHPDQPDSLEVLGLVAFEAGDLEAAVEFLVQRATLGPAPVRVYHAAASALLQMGEAGLANQMMEVGANQRPHSTLLRRPLTRA